MTNDTIKEIINDAHNLAQHCEGVPAQMLKLGIEGLVSRREKLYGELGDRALPAVGAEHRAARTDYARLFECPELNFKLTQFQSPQATRLLGYFEPVPKPGCGEAIPQNSKHVYEIQIDRTVNPYEAVAYCDGNFLFSVKSNNYQVAKFGAVKTLFGRMRHTCKGTRRNIAAKEGK